MFRRTLAANEVQPVRPPNIFPFCEPETILCDNFAAPRLPEHRVVARFFAPARTSAARHDAGLPGGSVAVAPDRFAHQ